jgi:integrase
MYIDGRRHYENLKVYLPKERNKQGEYRRLAEEIRAKRELELQSAQHGFIPSFKKDSNFIAFFEDQSNVRHKTWNTVLLQLKTFCGTDVPFKRINKEWLNGFQEFLSERVSQNTANVYMHKVKAALNVAVKEGIIVSNPCEMIDIVKTEPTERTFLSFEEIQQLADTPTNHSEVKRAFLFSCYTGLRLSDVKRLTRMQIVNDRIQFRQKKTGSFEYLPLSPVAMKLLTPLPENSDEPIFKLPKSEGGIWTHLQIWVTRAGISKHVSFHVARHTFATLALSNTKDLYMVSKLLGHKDIKHTQIYAKIVDDRKKEAVAMLPEITF